MIVGVLVGGASRRMNGQPKGLLDARDGTGRTVIARTIALAREVATDVVLVGVNDAYAHLGLEALADASANAGPLAGLVPLLERARGGPAIAVACDMPFLTRELFARLASHAPDAAAVAPRESGRESGPWSPLFARYDASRVLDEAKRRLQTNMRSLQLLLDAVGARPLPLDPDEAGALRDWDSPADMET